MPSAVSPGARGYPQMAVGGSTVWPPISHLTDGLDQPGPPWCRENEAPQGHPTPAPWGLAWPGGCSDRGPSLAPALGSQCPRGQGPIRSGCRCQEVRLLGQRTAAAAFIAPIPFCSFPSCPRDGELGRGILEMVEGCQPPAASPSAISLGTHLAQFVPLQPGPAAPTPPETRAKPGRAPGPRCQAGAVRYR